MAVVGGGGRTGGIFRIKHGQDGDSLDADGSLDLREGGHISQGMTTEANFPKIAIRNACRVASEDG